MRVRTTAHAAGIVAFTLLGPCGAARVCAQATPSPAASPNPIGPALHANDPCTSLTAIVARPTVTNSVCTVRPDHVEIESGYLNLTAPGTSNTVTFPQALIRAGTLVPALELELAPPQVVRTSAGMAITSGASDVGAGLKYVFGYTPKLNFGGQVFFTAPTGTNGASANGSTSTYAFNAGYTLSPAFSLATTLQVQSLANGRRRWASVVPSLAVSVSLPNATGVFAEFAQFSHATGPGSATRTQYVYGVLRGIGPRVQLDASAAVSPTASTGRYHGVGFGASYYF